MTALKACVLRERRPRAVRGLGLPNTFGAVGFAACFDLDDERSLHGGADDARDEPLPWHRGDGAYDRSEGPCSS